MAFYAGGMFTAIYNERAYDKGYTDASERDDRDYQWVQEDAREKASERIAVMIDDCANLRGDFTATTTIGVWVGGKAGSVFRASCGELAKINQIK